MTAMWQREASRLSKDIFRRPGEKYVPPAEMEKRMKAAKRILDVGAGSGVWGLALLKQLPHAKLIGFDLPEVAPHFLQSAKAAGLADRAEARTGDLFEAKLPENQDITIVANVLRLEEPARAKLLVKRLASTVAPGGRLVVVDALAGGDPVSDWTRALYTMNLAWRSGLGLGLSKARVHSPDAVRGFLREAGFSRIEKVNLPLGPGALGALVAYKE
jgi:trans-aconitate methyltransferase